MVYQEIMRILNGRIPLSSYTCIKAISKARESLFNKDFVKGAQENGLTGKRRRSSLSSSEIAGHGFTVALDRVCAHRVCDGGQPALPCRIHGGAPLRRHIRSNFTRSDKTIQASTRAHGDRGRSAERQPAAV